ncbi:MAG TPA: zinc ribbon domain-containing protein [Candidatus Limnocylindrales bacterium]|nr:zinc ribbon domain-containing protein [Candidatus Limnocylindrales bacterium]
MAGFCGSCGFPSAENSAFCPRCGSRQATGSPVAPPQPAPQMVASGGGSGLKILLVAFLCIGVAGAAVIGGLWYMAHRVKEAVVQKAKENGVDLNSIVPAASTTTNRHKTHKPCDLLSKEEAASMLGEPVEHTEYRESACLYYAPAGLSAKLAQDQASDTFKRAQQPDAKVSGNEMANAVDQLANSIGAASDQTATGGEMPLLMLVVGDDGKSQMMAISASNALFSGIFNAAEPDVKGPKFGAQIKGLGDQAIRLPKLGLNVLQGETLVRIITGPVPGADAKSIDIARFVLKRL